MGLISVIVTTYNWPNALKACLNSLASQQDSHFEIIIADDGSTDQTQDLIRQSTPLGNIPVKHVFHEDKGFRAGTIRNKAVAASQGDYLIFLDGDCVVFDTFIQRHRLLAESGYFVPGNRVLLSHDFTRYVLEHDISLPHQSFGYFVRHWMMRHINRILPLISAPPDFAYRYRFPLRWQKAMTCNLGIWKTDFLDVNGFDELFEGWGHEDSDLIIRLIHNGIKRKDGRFALAVLHLWHRQNDRSLQARNLSLLESRLGRHDLIKAEKGLDQYL